MNFSKWLDTFLASLLQQEYSEAMNNFNKWLDTFIDEKGLDPNHLFEKSGPDWGANFIPLDVVLGFLKAQPDEMQQEVKYILMRLDFANQDVMHFFEQVAGKLAR